MDDPNVLVDGVLLTLMFIERSEDPVHDNGFTFEQVDAVTAYDQVQTSELCILTDSLEVVLHVLYIDNQSS